MAAATAPPVPFTWTRHHVIDSASLSRYEIEEILKTARTFSEILARPVKKVPTLRGKVVVNMFYENSTRTRTSFELAGKYLSADTLNFGVSTSSVKKGESLQDTMETLLAMGTDAVVIRHGSSGICQQLAHLLGNRVCILNAGDGYHDHPSQGLLDLYTMLQHMPGETGVAGKKIAIVGDIAHSRVARSNIHVLSTMGADVHVVGPATLLPAGVEQLPCTVHYRLEDALRDADLVMCLRIQLERQKTGLMPSMDEYIRFFQVNRERLNAWCRPEVHIMHPGPMNRNIELSSDLADDPQRSLIVQQVANGVAIRMALLYLVLGAQANDSSDPLFQEVKGERPHAHSA
ncbi:MAG: aspartate carbamoyltransferase catalytic subunit [Candidatus Melainabacteria bacterium]|nr:aspartate carbamoyltransferase catalytic subunit [Candidatus Melainabacteria bacterium]